MNVEEFILKHGDRLRVIARKFLHDDHEADDAVQHAALMLLTKGDRIRDPGKVASWLGSVVVNYCRHRRRGPRREELPDDCAARGKGPAAVAELDEVGRALDSAVFGLTPLQREVLLQRFVHELSFAEIGAALGLKTGAVRAVMWRAKARLERRMSRLIRGWRTA